MKLGAAAALSAFSIMGATAAAQDGDSDKPEWDVANPPMETREVSIDVTEGTWMSLDVSPDGQTIAFDLLGDIYTMPMSGGDATPVSSGLPWEYQPRFSPDGSRLAFTSDRGGGDNIWIMNADGSDRRQVTEETFRLLNNPSWSPDGKFIAARKHFTTSRSLGTGEIWLYHVTGGGGVQLVEKPSDEHQKELGEPAFSPDGRYVYYSQNVTPGGTFIYAQDSNTDLFNIKRYDMETGEIDTAVSGHGGSVRPEPSPDGRYLAFVRRERAKSRLYLKDLRSGETFKIHDALDQDMQETWGVQGMYPNMDWTPDSQALVFWAGGKIKRIDIDSREVTEIPFRVQDSRQVIDPPRPQIDVFTDTFQTTMPRFAAVSPDGNRVVFQSLGKLYVKDMSGGGPRRLTGNDSDRRELFPAWSRDGSRIVFATWDDEDLGAIRTVSASGRGERLVTDNPGHYRRPAFSPDGNTIVFEKGEGGYLTAPEWSEGSGVYRVPAGGGEIERVSKSGSEPHFGARGDRVFMTVYEDDKRQLISTDLNGEARRVHASGVLNAGYRVSPAGDYVIFRENYDAYVMPLAPGPQSADASKDAKAFPVTEISKDGASWPHWSNDGQRIHWSLGPALYSADLNAITRNAPAAEGEDNAFTPPESGVSLSMSVDAAKPSGVVALTGARIVTMTDAEGGVIEDGVIVINGNRIAAVGAAGDVEIPGNAETVDMAGKTIIPGLIDAHAHGAQADDEIIPQRNWLAVAHLALGVTTVHDPSNDSSEFFAANELQRAGRYLGPRLFSTGEVVYGAKAPGFFADIQDYSDAQEHVRRLNVQGAHSIKNYNQPRRDQRQQVVAAAKAVDMAVVAEGGSLYHMDMAMVADGNSTIEHNIPQSMLYEDALSFYGQTDVAYTPTLVVTYGGPAADPYWRMTDDVWKHPILSRHVPPHVLQPRNVRRTKAPEEDFADQVSAATAKLLSERGVMVSIGAHGQEEGLGSHWEMWSFVRGGWSPLNALKAATITPARALGFDRDLGSLEEGKLADLVVLDANPLEDIRNSDDISHVMLNGRLYDPVTMRETATGDYAPAPYYWEEEQE